MHGGSATIDGLSRDGGQRISDSRRAVGLTHTCIVFLGFIVLGFIVRVRFPVSILHFKGSIPTLRLDVLFYIYYILAWFSCCVS